MGKNNLIAWWDALLSLARENLLPLALFCAVFAIFLTGLNSAQEESRLEGLRIVEESVIRSVVTCYAIEGIYPDDLAYLQQHYNLLIDQEKYYVQYAAFASNIMPQVTVMEVSP